MKKNRNLISNILISYSGRIALSGLCVVLAAASSYVIPIITGYTLDYVIGGNADTSYGLFSVLLGKIGDRGFFASHLYILGIILFLFTAANGLFNYLRRALIADVSEGLSRRLRNALHDKLDRVPFDYHKHINSGDIVQRCTSDVDTVRKFISVQLMEIVRTVFMLSFALIVMFSIHTEMALISMSLLPVLTVSSFFYFRSVKKHFTEADEAEGQLSTMIQESLSGIRVIKAFGQEKKNFERFMEINADYKDKNYRLSRLLAYYWSMSDMLGYIQIALSLVFGIVFVKKGTFTLGNVTVFASYTAMLTWPVRQLGRILADLGKASVSIKRINEILDVPSEAEPGLALKPSLNGDIVFDSVCFGYDRHDEVLKNISFTAHLGMTIGILGSTGSGKTSLVHLLQRLYPVTEGSITVNGININDIDANYLRSNIGIVLQEPFLFSRSILDNIRIVRPDASLEEVRSYASLAAVDDVIESFENGYETIVGEKGVTLSGGQRQRVAIARTLLQNPSILIFDDSMSAVDTETDTVIRNNLFKEKRKGITFIISHRITTLCTSDLILVLENGRLTQKGTHTELLSKEGLYRKIAVIQDALGKESEVN